MTKRAHRRPFAEVVREVRETPSPPQATHGGIADPQGRHWVRNKQEISPGHALALAAAGAPVAWDACGCGGHCGFTWLAPDEVAQLVRAGTPVVRRTKRRHGNISEWATVDGQRLVVAEDAVRWGDLLD